MKRQFISKEKFVNKIAANEIVSAQEKERNRIANDLHDYTIQDLIALVHKAEYCMMLIDSDPVEAKLELQTFQKTMKNCINDIRHIIFDLKSETVDTVGFVSAVKSLCVNVSNYTGINIVEHIDFDEDEFSSTYKHTFFRIIKEAVNNCVKHGKANSIFIDINRIEDGVKISIKDDGIGFDLENLFDDSSENFGLKFMRDRSLLLGGTFEIDSSKGKGTILRFQFPVNKA